MPLENFSIIESTLREGEQFVNAFFTTAQKIRIEAAQELNVRQPWHSLSVNLVMADNQLKYSHTPERL